MADQNAASGASKLGLIPVITKAMFSASVRLWTSPFKGSTGAHNYFKDVMFAMMRTQLGNLSLAQDRALAPLTTPNYLKFAQDHKFTPDSITLPSGTQAHWFGNKNAKKVFLYFHGGGYVMSMGPGHMLWLYDFQNTLISEGADVAVIALAYDVAPEAKYPTQLRQAVELLRHLVENEGRDPADLILGGDSAGGNLTLSLLSHLAHPHPEIPALPLPGKIQAALLISPWVSFNTHVPSFSYNAEKDAFDSRTLSRWSTAFLGSDSPYAGDFYSEPVTAAPSWWKDVANVVSDVLIWGGGNEVLIDGIEEFARRFTKGFGSKGGNVRTVITPKAAHEEMILERILGYKGDSGTGSQPVVHEFVKAKL